MVDIYLATITHLCVGLSTHSPGQSVLSWRASSEVTQVWSEALKEVVNFIITIMLRRKTDVSSLLVHAPRQRSHDPWLACVFPSVRGIMYTFHWLACVFPSVWGITHTFHWLACVFPSVRGIMHTFACPFFELILRVKDMSSGTFLVGPGIVTVPFLLAFLGIRVLACSFKILCQCLHYHGLKHGPEIWVITELWSFSGGGPGLDLKHSSFALCGPFSSFSTSEYLSCGMKHAEHFRLW